MAELFFGTCGWSYKEWVGPFYHTPQQSKLRHYSGIFRTAEIDSTFYRFPEKGTVLGWLRYTPQDFLFSVKLPRVITHEKNLEADRVKQDFKKFMELMEPLYMNGKVGCFLIQLPPWFYYAPERLERFLELLPSDVHFAVEFRHNSWLREETWWLLKKHNVAYTIVDEPLLPPDVHVTSDIAYFRWHGHGKEIWYDYRYKKEELEPWVPKIREASSSVERVFGYFNNHFHGYAVENCLQTLEMLGGLAPKQADAKIFAESFLEEEKQTILF